MTKMHRYAAIAALAIFLSGVYGATSTCAS